jgi:hypothetical protein
MLFLKYPHLLSDVVNITTAIIGAVQSSAIDLALGGFEVSKSAYNFSMIEGMTYNKIRYLT